MDHSSQPRPAAPVIYLTPITGSSNIAALGYDAPTQTLEVQFANGSRHRYQGVPADISQAMFAAESKGRFFAAEIRGKFGSVRVDGPPDTTEPKPDPVAAAAANLPVGGFPLRDPR